MIFTIMPLTYAVSLWVTICEPYYTLPVSINTADILQTNDSLVKVMDLYKKFFGEELTKGDGDAQLMDTGSSTTPQQGK